MNIRDVLYMRNTGKLRPRASIQDKLLARKLSGGGSHEKTIDFTPVISVSDAKAGNALDYQCKVTAVQSGTGDPSPSNIRSITGWTGAQISVNGSTVSVSWQSEAGTVYGGVLDATNGTLTVTHTISTIDENRGFRFLTDNKVWRTNPLQEDFEIAGAEGVVCNQYAKAPNRGSSNLVASSNADLTFCTLNTSASNKTIYVHDERFINEDDPVTALKAWLAEHPIYYVQELAEPITYTITPTEIALLEGANTLWSDTGDSSMTYIAKK